MTHIESAEPLSAEQQELWDSACNLWRLLQQRDIAAIQAAIHPQYIGWEAGSLLPHDRDFALKAAANDPVIVGCRLFPLSVQVYDSIVGVVHYTFEAEVATAKGKSEKVNGRWTEVYLKKDASWLLISAQGGSK
ncbi:MAG: DUF4440 domain-containing protein [Dehalococcoidia bacterium]|nr:DUF4440 domain-containing protein [Dehalococcoidia bacterium]